MSCRIWIYPSWILSPLLHTHIFTCQPKKTLQKKKGKKKKKQAFSPRLDKNLLMFPSHHWLKFQFLQSQKKTCSSESQFLIYFFTSQLTCFTCTSITFNHTDDYQLRHFIGLFKIFKIKRWLNNIDNTSV